MMCRVSFWCTDGQHGSTLNEGLLWSISLCIFSVNVILHTFQINKFFLRVSQFCPIRIQVGEKGRRGQLLTLSDWYTAPIKCAHTHKHTDLHFYTEYPKLFNQPFRTVAGLQPCGLSLSSPHTLPAQFTGHCIAVPTKWALCHCLLRGHAAPYTHTDFQQYHCNLASCVLSSYANGSYKNKICSQSC